MNPEIKARWVEALRSGEYEQGRNHLQADGKFCCLGVLCELAVQDGIIDPGLPTDLDPGVIAYVDGHTAFPPPAVCEWAGFEKYSLDGGEYYNNCPSIDGRSLVELNDETGFSFEMIANLVEENL